MPAPSIRPPAGSPAPWSVRTAGAAGLAALAPGARGRVLAVFRRSCYVETGAGRLACLGAVTLGAGPLNALCTGPVGPRWAAAHLAPGDPVSRVDGTLHVGPLLFDLTHVAVWTPPGGAPPSRDALAGGLAALDAALTRVPPRSWARLLRPGRQGAAAAGPDRAALTAAARGADALAAWLGAGAGVTPPGALAALLGLGTGLTPAGDDWLGGVLIALRRLGAVPAADALAGTLLPLARERTPRISAAHLACAAQGTGAGALHAALEALCSSDATALAGALRALDGIGHTSGWDALAGVAAACRALVEGPC